MLGIVALITLGAAIVFIALGVGRRSASPAVDGEFVATQQGIVPAPDISSMSARERAARLYDRVTRLDKERKGDSIAFFAPMAIAAFIAIPDIDTEARYELGRIAMIAGELPLARSQRDTILRADSTHLLGLLLAAELARTSNDQAEAKRMESRFLGAIARERARRLPEYEAHAREITNAVERLGATGGR